jgi:hypothetical protein
MKLFTTTTIVTRRVVIPLLAAFVFAAALPQVVFAQSDPLAGAWKLNLAKSQYSPGPPPRSATLTYRSEGANVRRIAEGVDAEGKATKSEWMHIYDGKSYPTPGVPGYDTTAYTRIEGHIVHFSRTNAGKAAQAGIIFVSADGKTMTITTAGTNTAGRPFHNVAVYDKQ